MTCQRSHMFVCIIFVLLGSVALDQLKINFAWLRQRLVSLSFKKSVPLLTLFVIWHSRTTGFKNRFSRKYLLTILCVIYAAIVLACSRLSVSEDDRKRERVTSGISGERDPGSFFPTGNHSSPARFFNPPLPESLEQAMKFRRENQVERKFPERNSQTFG